MIEDQRQMSWCRWSEGGGTSDRLEEEVVYCEQRVFTLQTHHAVYTLYYYIIIESF